MGRIRTVLKAFQVLNNWLGWTDFLSCFLSHMLKTCLQSVLHYRPLSKSSAAASSFSLTTCYLKLIPRNPLTWDNKLFFTHLNSKKKTSGCLPALVGYKKKMFLKGSTGTLLLGVWKQTMNPSLQGTHSGCRRGAEGPGCEDKRPAFPAAVPCRQYYRTWPLGILLKLPHCLGPRCLQPNGKI